MTNSDVRVAIGDAERDDAFDVRKVVFMDEQGVDEEPEWDEHDDPDAEAVHFVASRDGDAVGAARLREHESGAGKVERAAVLESTRDEGWGWRLMEALEAETRERGSDLLLLHGQTIVEGFYRGLGHETKSDEPDKAGTPHVKMRKSP